MFSDQEAPLVWKHFTEIMRIPRSSGNEEGMRQYIRKFAQEKNLEVQDDSIGNLVVRRPASPGFEAKSMVTLQSHLDMVCEKDPETAHDFDQDPIRPVVKDEYLYADGTTLGADNGIGVALSLALLEAENLNHGPLECLFTIDEETGLTGAKNLSGDIIKGRQLINLDSEEHGTIYVGCAGGGDSAVTLPLMWEASPSQFSAVTVRLRGLQGGHSGCDIHLGRGNAIELLARILWTLKQSYHFRMHSFQGGDKHNAIPRNAHASIAICKEEKTDFMEKAQELLLAIKQEFGHVEPEIEIQFQEEASLSKVLSKDSEFKVLSLLKILPHGVISMNPDIPEMVNTSNNLARVSISEEQCSILTSTRSSLKESLESVREKIGAATLLAGGKVVHHETYPGWNPNLDSPLLKVTKESYLEILKREAEVKSIHAGLECGVIGEKVSGMDMVSIGPQIENPHSPRERVHIKSVAECWDVLCHIVTKLAS